MQNQNNPRELLDKMMSGYTTEQKQQFIKFASGFGITEQQLNDFGINSKVEN